MGISTDCEDMIRDLEQMVLIRLRSGLRRACWTAVTLTALLSVTLLLAHLSGIELLIAVSHSAAQFGALIAITYGAFAAGVYGIAHYRIARGWFGSWEGEINKLCFELNTLHRLVNVPGPSSIGAKNERVRKIVQTVRDMHTK